MTAHRRAAVRRPFKRALDQLRDRGRGARGDRPGQVRRHPDRHHPRRRLHAPGRRRARCSRWTPRPCPRSSTTARACTGRSPPSSRELTVTDAAGDDHLARRRRRRLPHPARAVRRGRHRAGAARARRPAVRRQRRARLGAGHGQALHQDRARGRRPRRSPRGSPSPRDELGARERPLARSRARPRPARVRQAGARRLERRRHQGASTGRSCDAALELAWAEDSKVLIEQAVVGREIECGVLSGRGGAPPAGERRRRDRDARAATSTTSRPSTSTPTPPSSSARPTCTTASSPRCSASPRARSRRSTAPGSRASTSSSPASGFVVNELNTMPGFTPISMFPKCWRPAG